MQHLAYLAALLFAITCIALTDYRYKLAFFNDWRRSCRTMGMALVFFIVWDVAGIGLTIFFEGSSRYTTGIFLAPHFPFEELFFLSLFNYIVLLIWTAQLAPVSRRHERNV